uniref:Carboxypeptidase A inhibitor-like domain-containing protein n=1 Tax=Solanum lycopersicum TaxID=4081 RepID=A0A3Q7FHU1_SOLLC
MASFKLFIALFVAILVNLSWTPNKMQVMALRDLPVNVAKMKGKLLGLGDITTCGMACSGRSDCKEGFMCSDCVKVGTLFAQCI